MTWRIWVGSASMGEGGGELAAQGDVLGDGDAQEMAHFLDDFAEVHGPDDEPAPAGVGEHLMAEFGGALRGRLDFLDRAADGRDGG